MSLHAGKTDQRLYVCANEQHTIHAPPKGCSLFVEITEIGALLIWVKEPAPEGGRKSIDITYTIAACSPASAWCSSSRRKRRDGRRSLRDALHRAAP